MFSTHGIKILQYYAAEVVTLKREGMQRKQRHLIMIASSKVWRDDDTPLESSTSREIESRSSLIHQCFTHQSPSHLVPKLKLLENQPGKYAMRRTRNTINGDTIRRHADHKGGAYHYSQL